MIVKFFPNGINYAQLVLEKTIASTKYSWQLKYICLLWSSLMLLTPFPLDKVFPEGLDRQLVEEVGQQKLLSEPFNKETQAIAYLMATYFKRPDKRGDLYELLTWMERVRLQFKQS